VSVYEWLARRSWKMGRFTADSPTENDLPAAGWEKPEILRDGLKADMERIVNEEAEPPLSSKEAGMQLAKFVKFREEKFGGVLFETRSEKVYTLNPTGAAVVREIVAGADGDVIERLKQKYQDPSGAMEAEAKAFLADLKAKGLVTE
jgi:hypothetical protein